MDNFGQPVRYLTFEDILIVAQRHVGNYQLLRACLKSPNPSLREAILGKNALKIGDFAPQMTKQ